MPHTRRTARFRWVTILSAAALTTASLFVAGAGPASANDTGSTFYAPASANEALAYSRVIRLQHSGSANGTLIGTFEHANLNGTPTDFVIRTSNDDGQTWSTLATLSDPLTGPGHPASQMWQPALFEFPTAMGGFPAGTLLLQGNMVPANDQTTSLVEWRSTDHGQTWSFVSDFQNGGAVGTGPAGAGGSGVWEPFMAVDSSRNLVTYFSDERDNTTYSQKLVHIVSTDGGTTWSANPDGSYRVAPGLVDDVASTTQSDRPGMATVAQAGNGTYFMSFEICGPTYNCAVHIKSSTNGDSWGSGPSDLGTQVQTTDGRTLNGTPYLAWTPAGGPTGELLLAAHSENAGESQQVIFTNTNNGQGLWNWTPAPLLPTGGTTSNCSPGYSPNLLVSSSGQTVRYTTPSGVGLYGCEEVTGVINAGVLPYSSSLSSTDAGWVDYGGCWAVSGGFYRETCGGNGGNKAVAGDTGWGDYTLQGDARYDSGAQAGLLVRVSSPGVGTDALDGYYAAVTPTQLILGREANGWTQLDAAPIRGGTQQGIWYHITVQAVGCTFTVSETTVGSTAAPTAFTYTDSGCAFTTGAVGVRDMNSTASFRNITVTPGGTTSTATAPYVAPFASGSATGWTPYGRSWSVPAGTETYTDAAGGPGDKSVAGLSSWADYTLSGDVQMGSATGAAPNAGLIARVTNPAVGPDALDGYYVGVTADALIIGRENDAWTQLASIVLPAGTPSPAWYHLTVQAVGCQITATAQPDDGGDQVTATADDSGCTSTSGAIGARTFDTTAMWKDVTVVPR